MVDRVKLGMGLFIASEATFFVFLILAYLYFHNVGEGPNAASSLDPAKTGLYTIALLSSSASVWLAGKSLKRNNRRAMCLWLLVTIALGAVFLFGQGREYAHLLQIDVTISRNLFGTTFFTLTGFHGLHVLLGLVALSILLGLALAGDFGGEDERRRASTFEGISLYWHFVDVVWIFIFSIVYLWVVV